ncbi:mitotic-spindle organizing protein 1 isoform X1 [Lynx canadensis]|uniref:mitotic-spindle organizing protein 1 n=1 Tax=Lynx rufus TaxID=61384 RepID=UPI0011B0CE2D|nr:mitotic-spindle organizing protein 1 isoform X1 [Lynx canadensis]XP_046936570.1 mitotic-spindle organizing protein 1 [Lynx rufus]
MTEEMKWKGLSASSHGGGTTRIYPPAWKTTTKPIQNNGFQDTGHQAVKESDPKHSKCILLEISRILNTGLDMETLSICVRLCEQGINPEALSSVIKELRKATEALKAAENATS